MFLLFDHVCVCGICSSERYQWRVRCVSSLNAVKMIERCCSCALVSIKYVVYGILSECRKIRIWIIKSIWSYNLSTQEMRKFGGKSKEDMIDVDLPVWPTIYDHSCQSTFLSLEDFIHVQVTKKNGVRYGIVRSESTIWTRLFRSKQTKWLDLWRHFILVNIFWYNHFNDPLGYCVTKTGRTSESLIDWNELNRIVLLGMRRTRERERERERGGPKLGNYGGFNWIEVASLLSRWRKCFRPCPCSRKGHLDHKVSSGTQKGILIA